MSDAREPSNAVIERIERFCTDYAQCLMDSTILVKRNYECMDRSALEKAEVVEDRLIRELAEDIATVGDKPKDNPRNYNPDGTPKIPNMNVGADPDWVDWVASLEHKEPLDLTEAVKQLMFEVICFGGEMGPNDCGGEYCPDEGMVYTNDFINGWVNKIAATAGKDIERYDGSGRRGTVAILQGGRKPEEVMFVGEDGGVTHYLPEGAGTCHMEVKDNLAESEGMGDVWLECDRCHWQMPLEPTTPRFKYCPNCRAEIKEKAE